MEENNKLVEIEDGTEYTEDKAFAEVEQKVQGTLTEIGQEVQEKVQEIQNKEFAKEQEEIMAEVKEHNEEYNKMIKELEEETKDGIKEMEQSLTEQKETTTDSTPKEEAKEITESIKETTTQEEETKTVSKQDNSKETKPPMIVIPKQDIVKKKKSLEYLIGFKDSIKKTVDISAKQKLKWTKEEIKLMSRVRAISNELETITSRLKIIIQQQDGYEEITSQLEEQPVADIKIKCLESGEFAVVTADTEITIIKGSKDEIKGFLKGRYAEY